MIARHCSKVIICRRWEETSLLLTRYDVRVWEREGKGKVVKGERETEIGPGGRGWEIVNTSFWKIPVRLNLIWIKCVARLIQKRT